MQTLSWPSIGFYCAFSIFMYYQVSHIEKVRSENQSCDFKLNVSIFAGAMTRWAYLLFYGLAVVWWAPVVIVVIGLAATISWAIVEDIASAADLRLGGFVGWPVCAFYMFSHVPIA